MLTAALLAGIDLSSRQNPFIEAFALVTMAIYLGMVHLLMLLLVASFFSRTALLVNIGGCFLLILLGLATWHHACMCPAVAAHAAPGGTILQQNSTADQHR